MASKEVNPRRTNRILSDELPPPLHPTMGTHTWKGGTEPFIVHILKNGCINITAAKMPAASWDQVGG